MARLVGMALQTETDQIVRRIGATVPASYDMMGMQIVAVPPNRPPAAGGTSPVVALANLPTERLPTRSVFFANGRNDGGLCRPGTRRSESGKQASGKQFVQKRRGVSLSGRSGGGRRSPGTTGPTRRRIAPEQPLDQHDGKADQNKQKLTHWFSVSGQPHRDAKHADRAPPVAICGEPAAWRQASRGFGCRAMEVSADPRRGGSRTCPTLAFNRLCPQAGYNPTSWPVRRLDAVVARSTTSPRRLAGKFRPASRP